MKQKLILTFLYLILFDIYKLNADNNVNFGGNFFYFKDKDLNKIHNDWYLGFNYQNESINENYYFFDVSLSKDYSNLIEQSFLLGFKKESIGTIEFANYNLIANNFINCSSVKLASSGYWNDYLEIQNPIISEFNMYADLYCDDIFSLSYSSPPIDNFQIITSLIKNYNSTYFSKYGFSSAIKYKKSFNQFNFTSMIMVEFFNFNNSIWPNSILYSLLFEHKKISTAFSVGKITDKNNADKINNFFIEGAYNYQLHSKLNFIQSIFFSYNKSNEEKNNFFHHSIGFEYQCIKDKLIPYIELHFHQTIPRQEKNHSYINNIIMVTGLHIKY